MPWCSAAARAGGWVCPRRGFRSGPSGCSSGSSGWPGPSARPVVVVAAVGQELPDLAADIVIACDPVAGRGPLQGLAAGFAEMPGPVELVYATATDVPFLEPRWISRLVELIGDADLVIPRIDGHLHPLAALYRRKAVLPVIERLLAEDRLRTAALAEAVLARVVDEDSLRDIDPRFGTLRNLNHPEDYEEALRDATRWE